MRIPIFQERISEIFELPISKTIALDECHSLGSLLYGYFISKSISISAFYAHF